MTTSITIGVFGQSFAQALLTGPAKASMTAEFARADYTLNLVGYGVGGSSMLKENCPPSNPNAYWWDLDLGVPGPALTSAIAYINSLSIKPSKFVFMDGEADSVVTPLVDPARWISAASDVIWRLKQTCNPSTPNNVSVFMQMIGRRIGSAPTLGVQVVREAQIQLDLQSSLVYGFDVFDLPLLGDDPIYTTDNGNSHMDTRGNALMGWRAAQRILLSIGKPARISPSVVVSRIDDNTIEATITAQSNITHPTSPSHFAVRLADDTFPNLTYSWAGDVLTIVTSTVLGVNAKLLFPYGDLNTINRDNLIYDETGQPLRTFSATI